MSKQANPYEGKPRQNFVFAGRQELNGKYQYAYYILGDDGKVTSSFLHTRKALFPPCAIGDIISFPIADDGDGYLTGVGAGENVGKVDKEVALKFQAEARATQQRRDQDREGKKRQKDIRLNGAVEDLKKAYRMTKARDRAALLGWIIYQITRG